MNILPAPIYALYSLPFYRRLLHSKITKGIYYILYLSLIVWLFFLVALLGRFLPEFDRFVDWVKGEMPPLYLTADGFSMKVESPYVLVHPQYGPLITFDMNKTNPKPEDLGDGMVLITPKKILLRDGEHDAYFFGPQEIFGRKESEPYEGAINGEFVQKIYDSLKPKYLLSVLIVALPLFSIGNLMMGFFYSGMASVMNLFRKPRLSYVQILNLCFFTMTAGIFFQSLQLILPPLTAIPFGFFGNMAVTSAYLIFFMKKTESGENDSSEEAV